VKKQSFIVTGAAGFIGSNLAAALNRRGHADLTLVDHLDAGGLKARNIEGLIYSRFLDKAEFRAALRAGDIAPVTGVLHLGACSSTTQMDEAYLDDNNVAYTRELCEWSLNHGARFVYASSAATYGDGSRGYSDAAEAVPGLEPLNPYGWSKQRFDLWALNSGRLPLIAGVKYFNVYGPREDHKGDMRSVIHKAYRQILDTGGLQLFRSHRPGIRDGEQRRDFVYVRDAVNVTLFLLDHPEANGLFNCGTGEARTWLDLTRALFRAMGREPRILFVDMPEAIRERYQYFTEADLTRLRAAGYAQPFTSIEAGVRDYVETWLSRPA
jgi:ADP-L-glycero-D-manno-heptose 6-epimerase